MKRRILIVLTVVLGLAGTSAEGQSNVRISGLAYLDYYYMLASPDEEEEGANGFDYRRVYLTTDFRLSDSFSGRARLEAKGSDITPFVKDLYLRWSDAWAEGQDLTFGVTSPPAFEASEKFWAFRSLQKTIMDRNGIVSSRDFGLKASGDVIPDGRVRYGVMVANDNGTRAEDDKYKRVYGQLEWYPDDTVTLTLEGDIAPGDGSDRVNFSGFAGYGTGSFRIGAEGFYNQTEFDSGDPGLDIKGLALMAIAKVDEQWDIVGRFDHVQREQGASDLTENFFLGALVYRPEEHVELMPNVFVSKFSDEDALVTGRFTVHLIF